MHNEDEKSKDFLRVRSSTIVKQILFRRASRASRRKSSNCLSSSSQDSLRYRNRTQITTVTCSFPLVSIDFQYSCLAYYRINCECAYMRKRLERCERFRIFAVQEQLLCEQEEEQERLRQGFYQQQPEWQQPAARRTKSCREHSPQVRVLVSIADHNPGPY